MPDRRQVTVESANWIRPLGSTGLQVTAVGAGCAPLGNMPETFGYEVAETSAVETVQHLLSSPLRWLDTSNGYGDGESERRIGVGISAYGGLPDDFLVATKVDPRRQDYSGDRVRASVAESKERLGLETLPMVYLHDPEFHDFDSIAGPGGAIETLQELKASGEIGHLGLAGGDARVMARYLALGGFEVLLVHNRWTLVDRSATELIAQASAAGIAVVNAAIYGGGILANPRSSTRYCYREASSDTLRAIAAMDQACRDYGTELAIAALQHSVNDPLITATIVGLTTSAHVDAISANLAAPLPEQLFTDLEALAPSPDNWLEPPN